MTAASTWPPPPPPEHPEELLSAYLDGEITADERAYVDEHLTTCSRCRAELDEERDDFFFIDGEKEPRLRGTGTMSAGLKMRDCRRIC